MATLKYLGPSHFRILTKADFVKAGIDKDLEGLSGFHLAAAWVEPASNPKNLGDTVEVPQEVADFLLRIEPKEWSLETDAPAATPAPADGVDGLNDAVSTDAGTAETTAGARSARTAR